MAKAMDVALFLSQKNIDRHKNTKSGNMMIQKLLFFANLIHISEHDEPLFVDEPILAFKQGCVVEQVRLRYQNNYNDFSEEATNRTFYFTSAEEQTINKAIDIFSGLPAKELSELNHQFDFWKHAYERSIVDGQPLKSCAEISINEMTQEIYKIGRMLEAHSHNSTLEKETFNGRTFYYDPSEIIINNEVRRFLEGIEDEDEDCYTLTIDEGRLVIY